MSTSETTVRCLTRGTTLTVLLLIVSSCGQSVTAPTPPPTIPPLLRVEGSQAILLPGETAQLQVMKYEDGRRTDLTLSAVWSSSDVSVVAVSSPGLATAVAPGAADVSAAVDSRSATILIRVTRSHQEVSGQIDPEVAADIIDHNQEINSNLHKGTITRFELPIPVFVSAEFTKAFNDFALGGVQAWQRATGLPFVFLDQDVEPQIRWLAYPRQDNRAGTGVASANLDNSLRSVWITMPTSWSGIPWTNAGATIIHEMGHAIGIFGHPSWGRVMAPAELFPGQSWLNTEPNEREIRFVRELYALPHGAHLERDGTWVVRWGG
jgi:hypothetical protein